MDASIINAVAAVASALAAFGSVCVAVVLGWRSETLTTAQQKQAAFAVVSEWRRDLLAWANEAIDVLSESIYSRELGPMSESDEVPSTAPRESHLRYSLSSLIDRGRLFLPKVRPAEHGTHKPTAYRGFRHAALDPLVAAERILSRGEIGRFETEHAALEEMRREFVSAIQRILDPERHNIEVARLIREGNATRAADPTLGGLVSGDETLPAGAEAMLHGQGELHHDSGPYRTIR